VKTRKSMCLLRILTTATLALLPVVSRADWPTIVNNTPLAFGDVIAGPLAGTVTISTAGVRTIAGGVVAFGATGYNAANFTINIPMLNRNYTIVLPASTTLTGPGTPMTVDTFTCNPCSGRAVRNVPFPLDVGAMLHVGVNQATGSYSGSFLVTVNNP
jgi:hypothetical protein